MRRFERNLYSRKNEESSQMSELCVGGLRVGGPGGPGRGLMCSEVCTWPLPDVSAASPALPSDTQSGPRHCLVGVQRLYLSSETF